MTTTASHLKAIGKVAYEWSRLEFHMQIVIGAMSGLPLEKSLILTNASNMKSWTDMVLRLARNAQSDEAIIERFIVLKKKIDNDLLRNRNKVIHGIWSISWDELYGPNIEPDSTTKASVLSLLKMGNEMKREDQMTADEILEIATQIRAALRELIEILSLLLNASPKKPSPT